MVDSKEEGDIVFVLSRLLWQKVLIISRHLATILFMRLKYVVPWSISTFVKRQ
jgi:hypothetical protein